MTTAFDPQGALLQISASTTAETYISIGEVKSFTLNRTAPEIDVTNFDSTFREFLSGVPEGGKWSATCNLQANTTSTGTGQYLALDAYNTIAQNRYFRIILDNSTGTDSAFKWTGPVLEYNVTGSVDNAMELSIGGRANTTSGYWAAST